MKFLYHPSIVPGGGTEQANCFPVFYLQIIVKRAVVEAYVATPRYVGAMPHVHHPTFYVSATRTTSSLMDQTLTPEE